MTAFDELMGQIRAMKSRSETYEAEEKEMGRLQEAEKHMRVFCVLRELERLGMEFKKRDMQPKVPSTVRAVEP